MNFVIGLGFIQGMMVGVEWDYDVGLVIIDLFILRIIWDYNPDRQVQD